MSASINQVQVTVTSVGTILGGNPDTFVRCGTVIPVDSNGLQLEDHSSLIGFTGICRESELIEIISGRFALPESAIQLIH